MASPSNSVLRYVQLDYASHRDALLARVKSRWSQVWTDFSPGSLGVVLTDLIAWSTMTVAYTLNRLVLENFVSTMTQRESAVRIGSLVGYKLHGPTAASVLCNVTVSPVNQSYDVTLPAGTQVRSSNGLSFELSRDYVVPKGQSSPQTDVLLLSPQGSGSDTYQSSVQMYAGENYADALDTTLDLTLYVEPGQSFVQYQNGDGTAYTVTRIEAAPQAVSNNRLYFDRPWAGATGPQGLRFYETRIEFVEGQTLVDRTVTPGVEAPGFALTLSQSPVLDNSVSLLVNGQLWTEVDSLATAGSDDTVYATQTLNSGQVLVQFGDGSFGALLPVSTPLAFTYRVGGGTAGNVAAGAITSGFSGFVAATGALAPVTVYNATGGEGGQEAETLEEARAAIPAFVQTNDRGVTAADYVSLATTYSDPRHGRIKYARVDVRLQNSLLEGNIVVLYAWAQGASGGLVPVNSALKASLLAYLRTKSVGTDYLVISDGTATPVPLSLRFKVSPGVAVNDVLPTVTNVVNAVVNALRPGDTLYFSQLVSTLVGVSGVDTVQVATPVGDLTADNPNETFTLPDDGYAYSVALSNNSGTLFTGQLPVSPLSPWSFRLFLDGREALVQPDIEPGYARVLGPALNAWNFGTFANLPQTATTGAYYLVTDQVDDVNTNGTLYQFNGATWAVVAAGTATRSRIDLRTGAVSLSAVGTIGDFTLQLVTATGYERTRSVNVYAGYTGSDLSQTKRREVRAALRTFFDGLQVGSPAYARLVGGVDASFANVTDVIRSVASVSGVSRVALDTPSNTNAKMDAVDTELLVLGTCVLNNELD